MGFSVLGFSIPSFVLGYCFVWLFGLKLNLLPSQGYVRYDESIEGWISHLILPSLTLHLCGAHRARYACIGGGDAYGRLYSYGPRQGHH